MPCRDETHKHDWPKEGTLAISKCEIFCGYCVGPDAKKPYLHPWELRGHVRDVHARDQGLPITVSPRHPKPHVNPTSVKRKHTEVEESNSEEGEGSDNGDDDSADEEEEEDSDDNKNKSSDENESSEEDQSKSGKSKMKTRSQTKASSDPFVAKDNDDTDSSPAPLRLGAKAAARAKKSPMKDHAASFQPIGPKSGQPPAKRAKKATSMGPPPIAPMQNLTGPPPQMPMLAQQQYQAQYQQQVQGLARAAGVYMNPNGQGFAGYAQQMPNNGHGFAGYAQQMPNNGQRPTGNMRPTTGNMAPPPSNTGPPPGNISSQMNPQAGHIQGQSYGRIHPVAGHQMYPTQPQVQHRPIQTTSGNFYASQPNLIDPASGYPNHQRLRNVTTHMLAHSNMSETSVINHYQQEIEYIRQLQNTRMFTTHQEQMRASLLQETAQQTRHMFANYTQQQQSSQRVFSGVQQPTTHHSAIQRPVFQQPHAQQVNPQQSVGQQPGSVASGAPEQVSVQQPGARQSVDPGLPVSSAPSAPEK